MFSHMQTATAIALIAGYFSAHTAAILTHAHAPDWVQGIITTVLTTLAGVIPTVTWNAADNWKTYLSNVLAAVGAAFLAYKTRVPAHLQLKTSKVGIGSKRSGVRIRHTAKAA